MLAPRDPPDPPTRPRIEPEAAKARAAPIAAPLRPVAGTGGTILVGADGRFQTRLPTVNALVDGLMQEIVGRDKAANRRGNECAAWADALTAKP
jgi:hypothetical protein